MRTRNIDTSVDLPGSVLLSQGETETAVSNRYFRPTGQWHHGIGLLAITPATSSAALFPGKTGVVAEITDTQVNPGKQNPVRHEKVVWACPVAVVEVEGAYHKDPDMTPEGVVTTRVQVGAAYACQFAMTYTSWPVMDGEDQLRREAISSAHPQRVAASQSTLVWQEVGELIESIKSFKGLFDKLTAGLVELETAYLKRNFKGHKQVWAKIGSDGLLNYSLKDLLRLMTQADLSIKLGLVPFLETKKRFDKAATALEKKLKMVTSAERHRLHGASVRKGSSQKDRVHGYHTCEDNVQFERRVHATLEVSFTSERCEALRRTLYNAIYGMTGRHVVSAGWELTPMSFIVDMFLNLGSFLQGWANQPLDDIKYVLHSCTVSLKETAQYDCTLNVYGAPSYSDYIAYDAGSPVKGSVKKSLYVRSNLATNTVDLSTVTLPQPKFNLPSFGQILTIVEICYTIADNKRKINSLFKQ